MQYRLYLFDANHNARAGQVYSAACDQDAFDSAALMFAACDDVMSGFEVWRGEARIGAVHNTVPPNEWSTASVIRQRDVLQQAVQETVCDTEERLQRNARALKASAKLLALSELRIPGKREGLNALLDNTTFRVRRHPGAFRVID